MKGISHLFPFRQQLVENLPIGFGSIVEQHHSARVDAGQELVEGLLMGGLVILLPVHVGQAPEEGAIAQIFGHLQILFAVNALGRPVIL